MGTEFRRIVCCLRGVSAAAPVRCAAHLDSILVAQLPREHCAVSVDHARATGSRPFQSLTLASPPHLALGLIITLARGGLQEALRLRPGGCLGSTAQF
jgi:hypothetical protein